jgi:hypothetical protein
MYEVGLPILAILGLVVMCFANGIHHPLWRVIGRGDVCLLAGLLLAASAVELLVATELTPHAGHYNSARIFAHLSFIIAIAVFIMYGMNVATIEYAEHRVRSVTQEASSKSIVEVGQETEKRETEAKEKMVWWTAIDLICLAVGILMSSRAKHWSESI